MLVVRLTACPLFGTHFKAAALQVFQNPFQVWNGQVRRRFLLSNLLQDSAVAVIRHCKITLCDVNQADEPLPGLRPAIRFRVQRIQALVCVAHGQSRIDLTEVDAVLHTCQIALQQADGACAAGELIDEIKLRFG
ncbi:hypothetical protein X961_4382 [Burkholderia pseudomallei MSHR5613]|nr:hypothetical protein X961_4382 [Burkholderia pseudomallei MSHR5613]